jgi:hypothetical protein
MRAAPWCGSLKLKMQGQREEAFDNEVVDVAFIYVFVRCRWARRET